MKQVKVDIGGHIITLIEDDSIPDGEIRLAFPIYEKGKDKTTFTKAEVVELLDDFAYKIAGGAKYVGSKTDIEGTLNTFIKDNNLE